MNRNKTFCEECRRDVEYMVETATIKGKLKGEEYEYTGKKAVCTECGSEVYVADIEDENLKALYDTYVKKTALFRKSKIDRIAFRKLIKAGIVEKVVE